MTRKSIPKEWFSTKYKVNDGSSGYLRLTQEAVNRLHHETAVTALEKYGTVALYRCLVDIGCACGDFTSAVARKVGVESAIGIDFVREGLEIGRLRNPEVEYIEAALPKIPLRDGTADVVLAMEVLYYLSPSDLSEAVSEISRICADKGIVIVSVNIGRDEVELGEAEVIDLFDSGFVHIGTIYEHAKLQQSLHTLMGKLIRGSLRLRIPFLRWLALKVRDNMTIARINFSIARALLRTKGISKGVFVFRKLGSNDHQRRVHDVT